MLHFVVNCQMAAERQHVKVVSDMEVHIKQRCGIGFLHVEKIAPVDVHSVISVI